MGQFLWGQVISFTKCSPKEKEITVASTLSVKEIVIGLSFDQDSYLKIT